MSDEPEAAAPSPAKRKGVSLAVPASQRELFGRLADPAHMLEVFRRELPLLTDVAIRVTGCRTKLRRTRAALREGRLEIVYKVEIELAGQPRRVFVLLGTAPAAADFLQAEEARCRALRDHPAVAPFRRLALHIDELRLALRLFPLDPALPALAEITGAEGARVVEPHLRECGAGARLERVETELRQYKPFKRAVLRVTAHFERLAPENGVLQPGGSRTVYAKLFADERERSYHELVSLWSAMRGASSLRMPEPLGYDAGRGMLLMSEASGGRDLTDWLRCLEKGRPLPTGVDLERLKRCMAVVAKALVELQRSGVRPARRRSFQTALGALERDRDALARKLAGGVLSQAEGLIRRLAKLAPGSEPLVPCHGCFRHKQMIGDESCLTIFDWDGLCLAEPALDAATFLGRLRREPLRNPTVAADIEPLVASFRREFLVWRPETSARRLALYEGLVLTEDLLRAFRRPSGEERALAESQRLARAAEEMLELAEGGSRPAAQPAPLPEPG